MPAADLLDVHQTDVVLALGMAEPVGIDDQGCVRVPDEPGLGVHLDLDVLTRRGV